MITPAECKAARGLLGWSLARLAGRAADISESTIRNFEEGYRISDEKIVAIRRALETAGVEFNDGEPKLKAKAGMVGSRPRN